MRFEVLSFEPHPISVASTSYGELPVYCQFDGDSLYGPPESKTWQLQWHGLRYNQILVYETARQLTNAGYQVRSRAIPGDAPGQSITPFTFDGIHIPRAVCNHDVVFIRNCDTGDYCILDMQDYPTTSQFLSASPRCRAVYMTMYEQTWIDARAARPDKFRPFVYFSMYEEATYANIFSARQRARYAYDRRLFFSGTIGNNERDGYRYSYVNQSGQTCAWREVARYLKELGGTDIVLMDRHEKLERRAWWNFAKTFRWNLFLPGSPWCNREHELWIRGCATLGFEYPRHPLMIPVIPNVHYAAVSLRNGTDQQGRPIQPKEAAQELLDRFYSIRDDEVFARQIAENAAHRMDTDASTGRIVSRILQECWNIQ